VEQANWDYYHPDGTWPGFSVYLGEKRYDTSKVGINIWDPTQGNNAILDSKVEDTEECKCLSLGFWLNGLKCFRR